MVIYVYVCVCVCVKDGFPKSQPVFRHTTTRHTSIKKDPSVGKYIIYRYIYIYMDANGIP